MSPHAPDAADRGHVAKTERRRPTEAAEAAGAPTDAAAGHGRAARPDDYGAVVPTEYAAAASRTCMTYSCEAL